MTVKIFLDCKGMEDNENKYIRVQIIDSDQRKGEYRVELWNANSENDLTLFFPQHKRIVGELYCDICEGDLAIHRNVGKLPLVSNFVITTATVHRCNSLESNRPIPRSVFI